ncbi:MAG: hypothetical protein ACK5QX_07375 [bacterium]
MGRAFVPESMRHLSRRLDPRSMTVLSDLARLFVCIRWAEEDAEFLARGQNHSLHFVVDADVAFNWANPREERSMMKLFDNETVSVTLSEMVGNWLFLPDSRGLPPTRMYNGHALEINKRVGPQRNDYLQRIKAEVDRISLRDRPLTVTEQLEIERFIGHAEGFAGKAEVVGLNAPADGGRDSVAPGLKLAYVMASKRVRPMSRQWIDGLVGERSAEDLDVSSLYDDWYRALPQDPHREHAVEADAGALAYVGALDQLTRTGQSSSRIVLLCGSHRVYRAWTRLKRRDLDTAHLYLRHPLCFLFTNYASQADGASAEVVDRSTWTAYTAVFESFLQRLDERLPLEPNVLFDVAYYLAWVAPMPDSADVESDRKALEGSSVAAWMARELDELRGNGERLATAQALSFRAREAIYRPSRVLEALPDTSQVSSGALRMSPELQLLTRLRYLEAASVDALLEQLISGVLAQTLPSIRATRTHQEPWRKVPILVFGPSDVEAQTFAIRLRTEPGRSTLSEKNLEAARAITRRQKSRYLALVLDALILAAFGEWAAAASMGRRAIERAEFFQSGSSTRAAIEQTDLSDEGKAFRRDLFRDTRDVDGREARYICAQAIRRSAQSLHDFEEADRHLRAFRAIVAKEDASALERLGVVRARSESLALELAQWSCLRHQRGQTGVGQLRSLGRRLEEVYVDLVERRDSPESWPHSSEQRTGSDKWILCG